MTDKGMPSRQNWRTPPALFAALHSEFRFSVDVAADDDNHLCDHYFTEERSGLAARWGGPAKMIPSLVRAPWAWVQPPYCDVRPWLEKAVEELDNGVGSTFLIPAAVDLVYWRKTVVARAAEVRLVTGRIPFIDPDTGEPVKGNRYNSAIVVFRPNWPGSAPHVHWVDHYWRTT